MKLAQQGETVVVEIDSIDALAAWRYDWERLLTQTPDASFFQTLEWQECYWKHVGREQRMRTLLVLRGDELVGILPLCIRRDLNRLGRLRAVAYPLDGWGTTFGPIGPDPQQTLAGGFDHLRHTPRDWDLLDLNWVPASHVAMLQAAGRDSGLKLRVRPGVVRSSIELGSTWEDYWESRSSKHRGNVRRAERRLSRLGAVDCIHFRSADDPACSPRWDLYETCERVANQSWQGSSTTGNTLTHERVRAFLRDVHAVASRRSGVSMHLLLVGGEPAAFAYNYVFAGNVFGLRIGYVPRFKREGAGSVLIRHLIEDAFHRRDRTIDLGEGDSPYKHAWRTTTQETFRATHYSRTNLRAQLLRLKRSAPTAS